MPNEKEGVLIIKTITRAFVETMKVNVLWREKRYHLWILELKKNHTLVLIIYTNIVKKITIGVC